MGHSKIAGFVSEENVFGTVMCRVDVPNTKHIPAYTKYFSCSAIYAVTPVDDDTMRIVAESINYIPVENYEMNQQIMIRSKFLAEKMALESLPVNNERSDIFDSDDDSDQD